MRYPATVLVDRAAQLGYGAIAITLHGRVLSDGRLFDYARSRVVLLVPGVEVLVQRRAVQVACAHGKPLVANSDAHNLWMFGRHYTRVEAEPNLASLFAAIRAGRVELQSPPVTVWDCLRRFVFDPLFQRNRRGRFVTSFPPPVR